MSRLRLDMVLRKIISLNPPVEFLENTLTFRQVSPRGHLHLYSKCRNISRETQSVEISLKDISVRHVCVNCSYTLAEQDQQLAEVLSVAQEVFSPELSEYREGKLLEKDIFQAAKEYLSWENSFERLLPKVKDIQYAKFLYQHIVIRKESFSRKVITKTKEVKQLEDPYSFAIHSLICEYSKSENRKLITDNRIGKLIDSFEVNDQVLKDTIVQLWLASYGSKYSISEIGDKLIEINPLTKLEQIDENCNVMKKSIETTYQYLQRVYREKMLVQLEKDFEKLDKVFEIEAKNTRKVIVVLAKRSFVHSLNIHGAILKFMNKSIYEDFDYYVTVCSVPESKVMLFRKEYSKSSMTLPENYDEEKLKESINQTLSIFEPESVGIYNDFTTAYEAVANLNKY